MYAPFYCLDVPKRHCLSIHPFVKVELVQTSLIIQDIVDFSNLKASRCEEKKHIFLSPS